MTFNELEAENRELRRLVRGAIVLVSEDVYRLPAFWLAEAKKATSVKIEASQGTCTNEICRCNSLTCKALP